MNETFIESSINRLSTKDLPKDIELKSCKSSESMDSEGSSRSNSNNRQQSTSSTFNYTYILLTLKVYIENFFFSFKDVFFCYILLCASMSNFSVINIPYTLIGLALVLILFNTSSPVSKAKSRLVYIHITIVVLNILIKVIFSIYYFNVNDGSKNVLFKSLGIKWLADKSIKNFVNSFLGDVVTLTVLILMVVFRERGDNGAVRRNIFENVSKINYGFFSNFFLHTTTICILIKTSVNISFESMFLSLLVHTGLILWTFNKSKSYHRDIYIVLMILLIMHIIATHVLNLYVIRTDYESYPYIQYLGVLKMQANVNYTIDYMISVLVCILCIIAVRLNMSYRPQPVSDHLVRVEAVIPEKNLWYKIRYLVINYMFSPYFCLHVCRLAVTYMLYGMINFPMIGLLAWLFYSFLVLDIQKLRLVTYATIWPALIYMYNSYMFSNIPNIIEVNKGLAIYCLEVFNGNTRRFFELQITIFLFAIFCKILYLDKRKQSTNSSVNQHLLVEEDRSSFGNSITLPKILLRLIVRNLDKISLIFMYLIVIQRVNMSHTCKYYN
jgi:hypothetical protein